VAGGVCSVIFSPIDLMKCRAQVNKSAFVKYSTEIPKMVSQEGLLSLTVGTTAIVLREAPGWACYFGMWTVLKEFF
jgi:hypothetical protein